MSDKLKRRISLLGAILFWVLFAGSNLYLVFVKNYEMKVDFSRVFPQVCFSLFVVSTFSYYRYIVSKADSLNFTDLLWKVFVTGLVTTLISLAIRAFFYVFASNSIVENAITINFFYNILVGLVVVFIISTFVVWKRLILYQRSKNLIRLWIFFELALGGMLIFDFLGVEILSTYFNVAFLILALFSIVLMFNLKWVAYLNFKQKWKVILFIILSGIYLYHFYLNLINFSNTQVLVINLLERVFIWGLLTFLFAYAVIAILVTLFNLPTSSVFEQKLKEALDFQKLSQSVPKGNTTEQTYETLLESAMSAVFADAAWLEIHDAEGKKQLIRNLTAENIEEVKGKVENELIKKIIDLNYKKELQSSRLSSPLKHPQYKSIIAIPIEVQEKQVGYLVLLQEVIDAFNREMVSIVVAFVNQASIALENLVLINESIENERYKEQLDIAKKVQKSLLPTSLVQNDHLTMEAFSIAAEEVGGDYYDILEYKQNHFGLIIGDVSGKGTSAAFQMAQMKGIFHSLTREGLAPSDFMIKANLALSQCLNKNSFITATYFDIDTAEKKLSYARGGHCPALLHCKQSDQTSFLESEGLGLGILRNSKFQNYVHQDTLKYREGDTLLLYTDGITEARSTEGIEFGKERLRESFGKHRAKSPNQIKKGIKNDLSEFTGQIDIDDDYTLVIVRFKASSK
ncbi:MAG: SpoIIE family protein phosphatase [Bacteroidota bacterium]